MSKNTQPKCTMEFKCLFHNNKIVKALTLFWGWDYHYCLCLLEKQSLKDTGQNIEFTIGFLVDKGRQTNDNVLQQNKQPHHLKKKKEKRKYQKGVLAPNPILSSYKQKYYKLNLPPNSWKWSRLSKAKLKKMLFQMNILFLPGERKRSNFIFNSKEANSVNSIWASTKELCHFPEHCLLSCKVSVTRNKEIWNSIRQEQ